MSKGMPKIATCATLTILVIAATHRPASTPTPIASAVMPNSLARRRARTVARAISPGRGTDISRARRSTGVLPMIELMRGGSDHAKGGGDPRRRRRAPSAGERHVVAMDHLRPPRGSKDMRDVARIAAADALGVEGVIGDEPASDLGPVLVANG